MKTLMSVPDIVFSQFWSIYIFRVWVIIVFKTQKYIFFAITLSCWTYGVLRSLEFYDGIRFFLWIGARVDLKMRYTVNAFGFHLLNFDTSMVRFIQVIYISTIERLTSDGSETNALFCPTVRVHPIQYVRIMYRLKRSRIGFVWWIHDDSVLHFKNITLRCKSACCMLGVWSIQITISASGHRTKQVFKE